MATDQLTKERRQTPPRIIGPRHQIVPSVILRHIGLIVVLVCVLYPLVWMIFASFGPSAEVFTHTGLLRDHWTLGNYVSGWNLLPGVSFTNFFGNSLLISIAAVVGNIVSCTMAAYAFARLNFKFRGVAFGLMLLTIMLPQQVLVIPQYIVFHQINWLNTFYPLIVPRWLATDGFYIFLMVQFIRGLPRELDEAAKVDGAGHFWIFTRGIVPLSMPAMATVGLFAFVASWNDFLGPLLYLTSPDKFTVPLGLTAFVNSGGTGAASAWGPLFAMCVISLGPVIGVFFATQKFLVQGIATSGIK
jgi:multiple sugar transport system permease protein